MPACHEFREALFRRPFPSLRPDGKETLHGMDDIEKPGDGEGDAPPCLLGWTDDAIEGRSLRALDRRRILCVNRIVEFLATAPFAYLRVMAVSLGNRARGASGFPFFASSRRLRTNFSDRWRAFAICVRRVFAYLRECSTFKAEKGRKRRERRRWEQFRTTPDLRQVEGTFHRRPTRSRDVLRISVIFHLLPRVAP